jgi:hypothetical protein
MDHGSPKRPSQSLQPRYAISRFSAILIRERPSRKILLVLLYDSYFLYARVSLRLEMGVDGRTCLLKRIIDTESYSLDFLRLTHAMDPA